mgnify:FL=1
MKALALEGGGARGAYEAGAIKALSKKKIFFDAVAGTSIGAINAAFYACNNVDGMYKLWETTDSKELFGLDGKFLKDISNHKFDLKELKDNKENIEKIIKNIGVDTTNIRKLLSKNLKEDKFYKSKINFGLVTFSISDLKPIEIFKKDIPKGKFVDYVLASAYLPGFKFERIIDDKYYLDGGVHMNCPIDMLLDEGYEEVYAVRAWDNRKLKYKPRKNAKVHIITPREDLGSILVFTPEVSLYRMNLGYFDTLKYLDNLDGNKYYFKYKEETYYDRLFDKVTLKRMIKKYNKGLPPKLNKDFIVKVIEKVCKQKNIERFKIYNIPYLITKLKYQFAGDKNNIYYDFIKNIKVDFED